MDVLSEVLDVPGVRGSAGARIAAAGDWGVEWVRDRDAVVYAVTAGMAHLTVDGDASMVLMTGDIVILATGAAHALSSAPGVTIHSCDVAAADEARRLGDVLRLGEGDVQTQILGASYSHDPAGSTPVFALLPSVIHFRAHELDANLNDIVRLLGRELARPGLATHLVLDRLVDVLLVEILRTWLSTTPPTDASWWGVLRDPLLLQAVTRIHESPGRAWTTEALAREVATSKQTLTRRFATFAGTTPGEYLTRWRMTLASHRLRDTDDTLDAIATDVGYTSVYAFSRAFHRERSLPPGRYRKVSRSEQPIPTPR
ncbi:AraC family transcriptional regulator [Sanguibacter inulinus]|uniref:AraC family transcriptional regulator n=1 Tax=Sanguibacter inulinus TaxID=60922 RepID=A0A853EQX0_9MICO|nr:AraC family transcriptional regulator [Sanguibacter inulinus]MBF0721765.1 AraC family transcriptional regulator [Sanguibacter inulinus]NYS92910.1 AraC family transcriptional regulator [Sanguibacter inulinus]